MRFGHEKWGAGPFGTSGGRVTWNFTDFRSAFNELEFAIADPAFQARVREAFDMWEAALDIEFVQVADTDTRADIQLGFARLDGLGGTLGQALTRFSGDRLLRASIVMDVDEDWTTNADFSRNRRGDPDNFFAVFAHELGHAIGIDHIDDPDALMFPLLTGQTRATRIDVEAGASLYGPREGPGLPGRQILVGLDEGERLSGGAGRDQLYGEGGRDRLLGGGGNDRLEGGRGNDRLWGGGGDDRLDGGRGADRLDGGSGRDVLTGGRGADVFVLREGRGRDRVTDFEDGRDRIAVERDADVSLRAVGAGVEVRIGGGEKLLLRDVDPDDLSDADFLLL
ncbi:MAG: matrixin family metalloprotease [Pseudomonadota bacterium]